MRPAQNTIVERYINTNEFEQVVRPSDDHIYLLVYQGQPVGLRHGYIDGYQSAKYKRTAWTTRGHGEAVVRRLNRDFATDQFSLIAIRIT